MTVRMGIRVRTCNIIAEEHHGQINVHRRTDLELTGSTTKTTSKSRPQGLLEVKLWHPSLAMVVVDGIHDTHVGIVGVDEALNK